MKVGAANLHQIQERRKTRPQKRRPLKPLKPRFPHTAERDYMKALNRYVSHAKELSFQIVMPIISNLIREAHLVLPTRARNDDSLDDFAQAFARVKELLNREFSELELYNIALSMGLAIETVIRANTQSHAEQVYGDLAGRIAMPPSYTDFLRIKARENVQLIKTLPERHFSSLQSSVLSAITRGTRVEDIEEMIDERFDKMHANAELIARDQVGKLNGQLTEMAQTDLGVTKYIWRTAGDDRVRSTHAHHAGETFFWNSPPADTGHPGQDFQCRCYPEPVLEDLIA